MQEVTPGVIVYTKPFLSAEPPSEQQVTYKPSNLKLRVGDKVEFSCVSGGEREVEASQATAVVLVARADSIAADDGPQHGCIVAVKEGFGFIRFAIATCTELPAKRNLACKVKLISELDGCVDDQPCGEF